MENFNVLPLQWLPLKKQMFICELIYSYYVVHTVVLVVTIFFIYVYRFDEPSSYLDVKQRLKAAAVIRGLLHGESNSRRWWFKSLLLQFIFAAHNIKPCSTNT